MKKVYQKRINKEDGDCMQAVTASLFEMNIEDIPDFIKIESTKDHNWFIELYNFYAKNGYNLTPFDVKRENKELVKQVMYHDNGINGYWDATVPSQTFGGSITHSVVVDRDLNIVHDPNPNGLALKLKPEDVISILTVKSDWYIDFDNKMVIDKNWKNKYKNT